MIVGVGNGLKCSEAKPLTRKHMFENNLAAPYYEPEGLVMSRTGQECIVALTEQWMLAYGEEQWRDFCINHVQSDDF